MVYIINHTYSVLKILQEFMVDGTAADSPSKKKPEVETKSRRASVSPSQEQYFRMLIEFCINEKSKGMKGGLLRDKDFKDSQVSEITTFLNKTIFFSYMLDIKGTTI